MTLLALRGSRVLLRPWRDDDLDWFAKLSPNRVVMEYLLPPPDRAASDALAQGIIEHFARHGFGYWAVELPDVCPFIGFVGLMHVPFEAHFTPAVEIGWRLDPAYWGQGYATEAASLSLNAGFGRFGFSEIVAFTAPANRRSRRVMERLGMTHAASDDFDDPNLPDVDPLKHHVLYRLRHADWRARTRSSAG
jgi:RimJ/RimL family protein N-acetyltransferase